MQVTNGALLMVIAALHEVVGVVLFKTELLELARAGAFDCVGEDTGARVAAFGFLAGVLFPARRLSVLPAVLHPFAQGADHVDVKTVESRASLREFIAGLMSYQPAWVTALYWVRGVFVRLLGMRQHSVPRQALFRPEDIPMTPGRDAGFFTVRHAEEEHVWVVAAADKHLEATLAVVVEPTSGPFRRFHVVTLVHYRNWAGPVYFNVIRPFHHLVVGAMARSGASVA